MNKLNLRNIAIILLVLILLGVVYYYNNDKVFTGEGTIAEEEVVEEEVEQEMILKEEQLRFVRQSILDKAVDGKYLVNSEGCILQQGGDGSCGFGFVASLELGEIEESAIFYKSDSLGESFSLYALKDDDEDNCYKISSDSEEVVEYKIADIFGSNEPSASLQFNNDGMPEGSAKLYVYFSGFKADLRIDLACEQGDSQYVQHQLSPAIFSMNDLDLEKDLNCAVVFTDSSNNRLMSYNFTRDMDFLSDTFGATEMLENNIPDSVSFWTQAQCSDYEAPLGYYIDECESGLTGTHGGCFTCAMSKVSLKKSYAVFEENDNSGEGSTLDSNYWDRKLVLYDGLGEKDVVESLIDFYGIELKGKPIIVGYVAQNHEIYFQDMLDQMEGYNNCYRVNTETLELEQLDYMCKPFSYNDVIKVSPDGGKVAYFNGDGLYYIDITNNQKHDILSLRDDEFFNIDNYNLFRWLDNDVLFFPVSDKDNNKINFYRVLRVEEE
jgi:hypothetical protein